MSLQRREHPQARNELRDAAYWYDDREPGLGEKLIDAIDEALDRIQSLPQSAPEFPGWDGPPVVRSMAVATFPYRVLDFVTDSTLVVLAYVHERRKPGYWQTRLDH